MKEPNAGKDHGHAVFICSSDDRMIPRRAPRFKNVFHAAGSRAIDRVAESEESIGAEYHGI